MPPSSHSSEQLSDKKPLAACNYITMISIEDPRRITMNGKTNDKSERSKPVVIVVLSGCASWSANRIHGQDATQRESYNCETSAQISTNCPQLHNMKTEGFSVSFQLSGTNRIMNNNRGNVSINNLDLK